jgi:hypothetical protein
MNKTITPTQYYLALAYFIIASDAQKTVREHEQQLEKILKNDAIGDAIYNPAVDGTKEDFDTAISNLGISVDWLALEKKKTKKEKDGKEKPNEQ